MLHLTLLSSLPLPLAAPSNNEEWPEFKGPHRTAIVEAVDTDYDWGEDGPEIVWRTEVGAGYGGAAVKDGEVFLLDREVGVQDFLRVLDLETGEEKWIAAYEAPGRLNFSGSRTVPTVIDDTVVTAGGFGHVTGYSREKEDIVWHLSLAEDYGGRQPMFGWSAAPLVVGEVAIFSALGEEVGLVGLHYETGEERWVTPSVGYSHSTPTLVELHGVPQVVFISTQGTASGDDASAPSLVSSFDPRYGTLLWQHELELCRLPIPGPVQVDDNRLFLTGGYRAGSVMLRVTHEEGEYAFEELFRSTRGSQTHAPVLHGDHLYLIVNENWNYTRALQKEGGLMCLSLDGKEVWRTAEDPYFGRGNMILAGDHLLIQDGFNGVLRVARATPEGYRQVAEANVFDRGSRGDDRMWAPMALARGLLLMRSQDELICVRL